jgi:ferredoxin-nitrite reductase
VVEVSVAKAALSPLRTFVLGVLSGAHIAFGAYLLLSVGGASPALAAANPGLQKILCGVFGLPFGLMMTVIGGGELFTGNTAFLTTGVVEKKVAVRDLVKNWVVSYLGNFVGALLLAVLAFHAGTLGDGPAAAAAAVTKTSLPAGTAFLRGVLCNWLVSMAVYMASGCSSAASKMVVIFFPISAFVALGLEHSIANMFLIPLGILRGAKVSYADFLLKNLLPVTLGNIVGGAGCVGLGYAAAYGSFLSRVASVARGAAAAVGAKPAAASGSYKVMNIRGGFTVRPAAARSQSRAAPLCAVPTGTSFLPAEAQERAQAGNNIEKIKQKKDPTSVWTDIYEYARAIREGQTNWEDIGADEIDVRVKYAGMFHRKKATPGKFMMRCRIPNGIVTSDDMRFFAASVRPYGPDLGVVDITTRMNIQLRSPPLEDAVEILKGLQARGLSSIQSGMDNLRNMVGSPIAGIDPHEIYDTRELARKIDHWYTNNGMGNPEWANMPRKFNIAISGTRDDFSHTHINDIGLQAVPHAVTGKMGFNVVLGGYISIKRAAEAIPMGAWVPEEDAFDLCRAILRLFRDVGARGDRQKTRLMWLIEEKTLPVFTDMVAQELASYKGLSAPYKFEPPQAHAGAWEQGHRKVVGVHKQKQAGRSWVCVHVPMGRLSADECEEVAALADKYSAGEVRFTVEQNVLLPNVADEQVAALLQEPALTKAGSRLTINPSNVYGHAVSCTGAQFCPLAISETKLPLDAIFRRLDAVVETPTPLRIHATGCPNSCGQVQVADIGLMGAPAKKANAAGEMKAVSGVNIFVGGQIGEHGHLVLEPTVKGVPMTEEDLVPALAKIIVEKFGGKMKV